MTLRFTDRKDDLVALAGSGLLLCTIRDYTAYLIVGPRVDLTMLNQTEMDLHSIHYCPTLLCTHLSHSFALDSKPILHSCHNGFLTLTRIHLARPLS
jgi:hypothetical protein